MFGAGHCTIFEGDIPVDVVAVSVRHQATYKTILRQDEAGAWLLKHGCPTAKAADLMEEAFRRRAHRAVATDTSEAKRTVPVLMIT